MSEIELDTEPTTGELTNEPLQSAGQVETGSEDQASGSRERWLLFFIAGIVILLDQWSKNLVESAMELYTYWAPIPALENIFRITYTTNTGVAFGLFPEGGQLFGIVALIVAAAIIYFNFTLGPGNGLLRLALGLQLGGAVGNLIDRVQQGHVTDFLDFGPWPVFNIADTAVVAGVILMAWVMLQDEKKEKQAAAAIGDIGEAEVDA